MPQSLLRLFRRSCEYISKDRVLSLEKRLRGVYVLYNHTPGRGRSKERYEVVYVGMARAGKGGGIRFRLTEHRRMKKGWTHFSAFEVWDNIRDEEVIELEGLFRHIYRRDSNANRLNAARGFKLLKKLGRGKTTRLLEP